MTSNEKRLIDTLQEIEVLCVIGNLKNCEIVIDIESYKSDAAYVLFKILKSLTDKICRNDYESVLETSLTDYDLKIEADSSSFQCRFGDTWQVDSGNEKLLAYVKQLVLVFLGVACHQVFVRINVCGPGIDDSQTYPLVLSSLPEHKLSKEECSRLLSRNGEEISVNLVQTRLLVLSHTFLSAAIPNVECLTRKWWLLRNLMIHQQILTDKIASLHDEMISLIDDTLNMEWMKNDSLSSLIFNVECAQCHLMYHEIIMARKYITVAQGLAGLDIELSGAFGKRTQYQQVALPQLFVKLGKNDTTLKDTVTLSDDVVYPKDLNLEDDTLLNKVSFKDGEDDRLKNLSPEEQLVLLGYCSLMKRTNSSDELTQEELMAFVNCMLEQPKVWCIYIKTLTLRCQLEKKSSRRLERSLMQLEHLIDSIKKDQPPFSDRLPFLHAVSFPMLWTLEKELADLWLKLGLTKSALAIYERLQLWQDIVYCYQQLDRSADAEAVVMKQLSLNETPLLWCLLGDIKDDPEMYLKADKLSNGRNARCQRSLGYYYYRRKEYKKSLSHFETSVNINYLQSDVWFVLGYAALQCEDYQLAARAYRQVVTLDDDNFEAWNNLSNAYIKTRQKERAWKSLHEALRCNYEEWKVWENFLLVSTDVGSFEDVIQASHRLLDIKGKYVDDEVIRILVKAINNNLNDIHGQPASRLRPQALKLLGRITSAVPNNFKIWESYSLLCCPVFDLNTELNELKLAIMYQQKAISKNTQKWEKEFTSSQMVLKIGLRLAELWHVYVQRLDEPSRNGEKIQAKLVLQPLITRCEKNINDFGENEKNDLETLLGQLKKIKNDIVDIQ